MIITSNANLFEIDSDTLNDEQINQVDDFIDRFKAESARLNKLAEDALEKWKPV